VLDALSIEHYLKALLQLQLKTPRPPKGHGLEDFFLQLSKDNRDRIKQAYKDALAAKPEAMAAYGASGITPEKMEFDYQLQIVSEAFTTWRYAYEGQMNLGFIIRNLIGYSVRRAILELHPEWQHVVESVWIPPTFPGR
jgi:hypothetical protein